MTRVLDKGELVLVDSMGSDLSVVQGARISNGAAIPDWRGAPDEKLIRFLAMNGHMSPFEHATFKFYIKCPIFVAREWMRHRTFSYNEMSGRYKELPEEFYVPSAARLPVPGNKQSSEWVEEDSTASDYVMNTITNMSSAAFFAYRQMIKAGIAREMARMVLPVNTYTEFIVTGNFRNWMHFLELRNSDDAQYEIRVYAEAIGEVLAEKMPLSYEVLNEVSRGSKKKNG